MTPRVLVTGATGNTGRHVTSGLRAEGVPVRTATRSPGSADPGTEHVRFDWGDTATYRPALTGIDRVYLVAPVGARDPSAPIERFLDVARASNVRRVVFLSSAMIPDEAPGLDRARRLITDMPEWAVLRPSWFMQNFLADRHHMATGLRTRGELPSATDGRGIGFVDAADIAAVGVRSLLDTTPPNRDYVITGPEVLSYDDIARVLNELVRPSPPVRHVRLSVSDLTRLIGSAAPADMAAVLARIERRIAEGEEERVTNTVAEVTGRKPRSFREFVAAHRDELVIAGES